MGTDIHGIFQARKEGGSWIDVPSNYDMDRHYLLFAWLGNVRNGYGFAGVPTHTAVQPLSDCRGLPKDFLIDEDGEQHPIESIEFMSPSSRKWYEVEEPLTVWMGDHSYSWVTGEEILETECPKITRTGIIDVEEYRNWDGKSSPDSWCGGISGGDVVVNGPEDVDESTTHVRITWEEDTTETFAYFIDEVRRLVDEYGEIRFVFGFDS